MRRQGSIPILLFYGVICGRAGYEAANVFGPSALGGDGFRPQALADRPAARALTGSCFSWNRHQGLHAAEYWPERLKMMQAWADYLDELRDAEKVIPLLRENA
jgi:hypothetical protein